MATPYLLYSSPQGEIYEETRLQALAFGARPLAAKDLIPIAVDPGEPLEPLPAPANTSC